MENLLFNIRPDLKGKTDEVKIKKFKCSQCGEMTIDGWEYRIGEIVECLTAAQRCNGCGTKELSHQVTEELFQKRIDALISNWYFISEKETAGFKNYNSISKCTTEAKQKAINYTQAFSQNSLNDEKNLLIMGSTGTGKTHISKAIARTLKARGIKVGFITSVDLFNKFKATFDSGSSERIFVEMKKLDLLIIDDIGVETTKIDDVNWSVRTWKEILDARLGQANVWTTNLDEENLSKVVGQRAFSRMYEGTRFIDLFTDDYRKTKTVK
ncbi:ATP-binding protein [Neobacillus massiliamazoniensis]|uniref:Phage protein n=1 Tax=Neobacillus massiliamazoniensis TaxID=1499688 RepID=A0A0U1NRG1_9BACI|nr:ATP-binding protein [Neobacillus massiliamazoniensis]CRK80338.1 Phage protein [Neobacillus massiliamazoniensis]